ncbi:MAG: hypothetical protein AMS26_23480 [Bacteroides sp. SM23_62]|nr:MAG: hypothetical protein AMS26_23480 [Bacteroides sp. SM23_62]
MDTELLDTVRQLLEEKVRMYNRTEFIRADPIQVPHQFDRRENIEIAAFLTATIAWGRRDTIIRNALDLMSRMDHDPYAFLMNLTSDDLNVFSGFRHRTFNEQDCRFFIQSLHEIYKNKGGLYRVFLEGYSGKRSVMHAILGFRDIFLGIKHSPRTEKHLADPLTGSAAKRLNMFLRWMIRQDANGVDFGIWEKISPADLYIPLDIHTGNVARKLGLLKRNQNDWKAVEELTGVLRAFDPSDPVKYDFALFGLGIFENY